MKTGSLKFLCAILALLMFASVVPQTSVKAAAALTAPKNAKIILVEGKFWISWNKVKGAKGYQVYRSVNGGKFKKLDKTTGYILEDNKTFKDGDQVSYYVKAYKKSKGKQVMGEASKTVSRRYSAKNTYGKVIKKIGKYLKENGIEDEDTNAYAMGGMPNIKSMVGVAVDRDYKNLAFSYLTYDPDTEDEMSLILSFEPNTDPCYAYTYTNSEGIVDAIIGDDPKLSKITSDTKRKKGDFFTYEVSADSETDYVETYNKAFKAINEYVASFIKEVDGVSMSDIGFKSYK